MRDHQGQQDGKLQVYEREWTYMLRVGGYGYSINLFFLHGRESFQLHIQVTSDERLV